MLETIKIMKLFAGLKKIREFERTQLPFFKSLVDFDIVIEIGYAEEQDQPLTLKQLFLLDISSRSTVRRRLAQLIERGIVMRRQSNDDHRATVLTIASSSVKLLTRYCGALASVCALSFK
jgi:DNA-binding MarR family transcriptional regulator